MHHVGNNVAHGLRFHVPLLAPRGLRLSRLGRWNQFPLSIYALQLCQWADTKYCKCT